MFYRVSIRKYEHGNLLAPSLALAPFTRAVDVCHEPVLFDLQALEIIIGHLCNSNRPMC